MRLARVARASRASPARAARARARRGSMANARAPPPVGATSRASDARDARDDDARAARHACQTLVLDDGATAGREFNAGRWDPVQQSAFADDRPWRGVERFFRRCVRGDACLRELGMRAAELTFANGGDAGADGGRRRKEGRRTFLAKCKYHGPSFAGFAWNASRDFAYDGTFEPGCASVSAALQLALRPVLDKTRPTPSAGRTDRGVSALASCVSLWSKSDAISAEEIERLVNVDSAPGKAGLLSVSDVRETSSAFHATFAAKSRRYVYCLPKNQAFRESRTPKADLDARIIDRMLAALVRESANAPIDMHAFARGTPPGKSSDVTFRVARAFEAKLPSPPGDGADSDNDSKVTAGVRRSKSRNDAHDDTVDITDIDADEVIVIELVADRFLRKLIRCLVATTIREAAVFAGDDDVLLRIARSRERRAAAPPAPALGLAFAGVEYD